MTPVKMEKEDENRQSSEESQRSGYQRKSTTLTKCKTEEEDVPRRLTHSQSEGAKEEEDEARTLTKSQSQGATEDKKPLYKPNILWQNIMLLALIHAFGLYALVFDLRQLKVATLLYGCIITVASIFGSTGGAHRLWSHRSYKVKLPLKLILLVSYSMAGHDSVFSWARNHRLHHKYVDTDADPYNSTRGFWFAHMFWLCQKKHPECRRRIPEIDMSDILGDPIMAFQAKYWAWIKLFAAFVIPPLIPIYSWGEDVYLCMMTIICLRYIVIMNAVCSINSFSHLYGYKPYDRRIRPTQNAFVSFVAMGEGWHNYHHVFPWDYNAAEFGTGLNMTARLIDMFTNIGWAYDLKTASPELVKKVMLKYGDGTHHSFWDNNKNEVSRQYATQL